MFAADYDGYEDEVGAGFEDGGGVLWFGRSGLLGWERRQEQDEDG